MKHKIYKGKEIYNCELGLYRIYWDTGNTSLGCVRNDHGGTRYINIADWIGGEQPIKDIIGRINELELIRSTRKENIEYNINSTEVYNKLAELNELVEVSANRWIDESGSFWYLSKKGFRRISGEFEIS